MRSLRKSFLVQISCLLICFSYGYAINNQGTSQDDKKSIIPILEQLIEDENVNAAISKYHELKDKYPDDYQFDQLQLNSLGYRLLRKRKITDAIAIFKLNVELFPDSDITHDSLAESYMADAYLRGGDKNLALHHYNRSLELNPDNFNAERMLSRMYVMDNYEKKEFNIPMRDGIKLFTQVYSPKGTSQKYPVMLKRTVYSLAPYGENIIHYMNYLGPSLEFAKEKFIFVYQDVRGKFMSEGEHIEMTPYKTEKKGVNDIDETTDTYDTIEWLLNNIPNHNGKVGMWGTSYPGFFTVMGLIDAHPALVAACPQAPMTDWFIGDDVHHNGAFCLLQGFLYRNRLPRTGLTKTYPPRIFKLSSPDLYSFLLKAGTLQNISDTYFTNKSRSWNNSMNHGNYDDYWKSRNTLPHLHNIKAAVMTVGGWFDAEDLYGPLKTYATLEKNNPGIKNTLVMGPWYHGGWNRRDGDFVNGIRIDSNKAADFYHKNMELPFFTYHLKNKGTLELPEAYVFETGSNEWKSYDQWPPASVEAEKLYMRSDGKLSFTAPNSSADYSYDEYLSDPDKPVPHFNKQKRFFSYEYTLADQRFAASRLDVLVYETEVLESDITILGPIIVELYVSTTGTDSDWVVKLIDVLPDHTRNPRPNPCGSNYGGYQRLVRGEIMRGKYRNSFENPEPFEPGKITKVKFELQDINHRFLAGHKIMVQIQSSWFPLFDRNPQKFVDIYHASKEDFQKAFHRVYRSDEYPTHINIKILK